MERKKRKKDKQQHKEREREREEEEKKGTEEIEKKIDNKLFFFFNCLIPVLSFSSLSFSPNFYTCV